MRDRFNETVAGMVDGTEQARSALREGVERTERVLGVSGGILGKIAYSGVETVDTKFVDAATQTAARIETRFAEAIAAGEIDAADLFDNNLVPIAGSNSQQYMTRYIAFLDRVLPPIEDPILAIDDRIVFCATTDHNQLIPTHNPQFMRPHGSDPARNAANGRNRRKYTDKTAASVSHNTEPFLLQTYRRDMGGGVFTLMKDVSAPIRVSGRLWGSLRVCCRA